jgi:hypothetical protein
MLVVATRAVLIAATLIGAAIPIQAQQPAKLEVWQTSWTHFVKTYNACLKTARCNYKKFLARDVIWEGTVSSIDLKKTGIGLEMGGPQLTDKNGSGTDILIFYLKPSTADTEKWKAVKVGDLIKFKTRTDGGLTGSVVSFVPVMQTTDGKEVKATFLNSKGGKLISVLPPQDKSSAKPQPNL